LRPSATTSASFLDLPETTQAIFINDWALYLTALGRLAVAARCYELVIEMMMRKEDWKNASAGNQNLCEVWLLSGRLSRLPQDESGKLETGSFRLPRSAPVLPKHPSARVLASERPAPARWRPPTRPCDWPNSPTTWRDEESRTVSALMHAVDWATF